MIIFFGPKINGKSKLTGGLRRFSEAYAETKKRSCYKVRITSLVRDAFRYGFNRKTLFVVFDERYLFKLLPMMILRRNVIFFPRGNKIEHFRYKYGRLRLGFYKTIFSFLYRFCKVLVFQTIAQRDEFKEVYYYNGPYKTLPNHIKASWIRDYIKPLELTNLREPDKLVIGFLGGKNPRKGFHYLYNALSAYLKMGIISINVAGAEEGAFEGLKNVVSCGFVQNISDFYNSCDLIMIPSEYDSFPNVLLESIAFNTPVMISRSSITEEICGVNSHLLFNLKKEDIQKKTLSFLQSNKYRELVFYEMEGLFEKYDFNWGESLYEIVHDCRLGIKDRERN